MPTWRIEDGECRDSLAMQVAAQCKLPAEVVARASQLYQACPLSILRIYLEHVIYVHHKLIPYLKMYRNRAPKSLLLCLMRSPVMCSAF